MLLLKNRQKYKKRYGRGALGNLLQSVMGDSSFRGGIKDIGKSLLQKGISYAKPILKTGYDAGRDLAISTGKQIVGNLAKDSDKYIALATDSVRDGSKKFTQDLLNSRSPDDVKMLIDRTVKNTKKGTKKNIKQASNDIAKSLSQPVVASVAGIPTKVGRPMFNESRIENIVKAYTDSSDDYNKVPKAKPTPSNVSVSSLIAGQGSRRKTSKKNNGDGLNNFGSGLYNFGQKGQGLVRL
jgi:hypothetical protein